MEIVVADNGMINFILSDAELWKQVEKSAALVRRGNENLRLADERRRQNNS